MPITDRFILPGDVLLMPVAELPDSIRAKVHHKDGDLAITRPHLRTPSKIVGAQAAELLKEFETARTIVEAVLNYSQRKKADPHRTLEEALPLLQNFIDAHLLVRPDSPEASRIEATLAVGDSFDDFEIRQAVQILEDTELYQARSTKEGEGDVALKIMRNGAARDLQEAFDREGTVLEHLDGKVNPRLIKKGMHDGRSFLAMEWVYGVPVSVLAEEIRGAANDETGNPHERLAKLSVSLLESYAHLHEQGVLHSDVHTNNLLVNDSGAIKILDYGSARFTDASHPLSMARRAGVSFYFEPECARAVLLGKQPPPSTPAGEQYAIAAVAYQFMTGATHIDFSLHNEESLRQISEEDPLPFSAHGLTGFGEMERTLARALHKDPESRFPSLREFVEAARAAATPSSTAQVPEPGEAAKASGRWATKETSARLSPLHERYIERVLERLQPDGDLFRSPIGEGEALPTCSADYGTAGIAYSLLRLSSRRNDPQLLALADLWITKSLSQAHKENAFYNEKLELTKENVTPVSLHHMINGVFFVKALVSQALGDTLGQQAAMDAFVGASGEETNNLDFTLGRSSVLHGWSLLVENAKGARFPDSTPLIEYGDELMNDIWSRIETFGPVSKSTEISYLGMAHGWAGVLYAALRWCQVRESVTGDDASTAFPEGLTRRLKELGQWGLPAGRGLVWSWQNEVGGDFASGNNGFMPGWCNGNAGHVFLWTLASDVLKQPEYLDLARRAGWGLWEQPSQFNNLCCGAGGCAYAMLNLYRHTGDRDWLSRGRQLAHRVVIGEEPPSEHPTDVNSLYKGEIGQIVLLDDLANPESARMPLFE